MPRTILRKNIVRDLNREIDKASNALNRVMDLTETLCEGLDTEDATPQALAACDDLDTVHDDAEEADEQIGRLFDRTEKLRRYSHMIDKRRK